MISDNKVTDKAGEQYWSEFWKNNTLPAAIDLNKKGLKSYPFKKLNQFFHKAFSKIETEGKELLEIGCGNSVYLSYFSKYHHFSVSGIDYSKYGCDCTRKILERDGVPGNVHLADLFNPPVELIEKFDVVCSFGVVEHFEDTAGVIRQMSKFLKPGGILITTIPNLTGLTGTLQKWMNKPVYSIHKVMGISELSDYTKTAGLEITSAENYLPMSFGVTLTEHDHTPVKYLTLKKIVLKGFQMIEKIISAIDDSILPLPKSRFFCAGFLIAARKNKA